MNTQCGLIALMSLLSFVKSMGEDLTNSNRLNEPYVFAPMLTNLLSAGEQRQIAMTASRWRHLSMQDLMKLKHTLATNGTSLVVTLASTNGGIERVIYNDGEATSLSCKDAAGSGFDASFFSGMIRDFTRYNKYNTADIDFTIRFDTQGRPVHLARFSNEGRNVRFYQWDEKGQALPPVEQDIRKSPIQLDGTCVQTNNILK